LQPAALDVAGLSKSYRKTRAIDDISFSIAEGSLTVLLGAAGAGKTTTLRLIAGLERPDAGQVILQGRNATDEQPKDRDIAMIFDNLALYPNKSGFENLAHPLRVRKVPAGKIEERVDDVAAKLRIAHVLRRLPKTMSGGERQRIALGRALVRDPSLFLLDEPLSSLDAMLRIELRAELKRLQRELGSTFLLATPDFAEAMAVADTIVMLRNGRVVQIAAPQSIYDGPIDREVARFVGAPEINLVKASFVDGSICFAGARFEAARLLGPPLGDLSGGFEIGIRPENLLLQDPATASIKAKILDVEPLGLKSVVTARNEHADLRLVVAADSVRRIGAGDVMGIDVASRKLLAFDQLTGARVA
jgi:multiple sugar transport system ATP-binding protein